jgi:hypothetical protein
VVAARVVVVEALVVVVDPDLVPVEVPLDAEPVLDESVAEPVELPVLVTVETPLTEVTVDPPEEAAEAGVEESMANCLV